MWNRRTKTRKLTAMPGLESLPPTDLALELNIKHEHFKTILWKSSLQNRPPPLDPCEVKFILTYGYEAAVLLAISSF